MFAPVLPHGYHVERDADVLTLLRIDGSAVARFSARGVRWQEVERTAAEDALIRSHERHCRAPLRRDCRAVLPRRD
jgi:hypothetical protein